MKAFIKKHEYNYIKRCLLDLNNALRNCVDNNIVRTTKAYQQDKILNIFSILSEEEKKIIDISNITDSLHIDNYLKELDKYVYGMPPMTDGQISKLFKKEKKLKFPPITSRNGKLVYLGWIDESTKKLLIAYNYNGKFIGMACRLPKSTSKTTCICSLCNHVAFVIM